MEYAMKLTTKKYPKGVICFLLCLAVLCLTFLSDYQEAYAFFPVALAAFALPDAVYIVGALLVAAGLTWATNEAIDTTAEWYYSEVAPGIKEGIFNMVESASNGIANVSADVWNATVEWVNARYNVGQNTITKNFYEGAITIVYGSTPVTVYLPVNYNVNMVDLPVGLPVNTDIIIGQDIYNFHLNEYGGTNKTGVMYLNGQPLGMSIIINTAIPYSLYLEVYNVSKVRWKLRFATYNTTQWESPDTIIGYTPIPGATVSPSLPATSQDVSATGQSVVDTSHDIVQSDGTTRMISYPSQASDLVNKTKSDVVVTSSITPFSNSWQGTFRDCVPEGAYTFQGSGTATIGYDVSGTWEGVWSTDTQTGARVWTGTFTDASSNTWSGTITGQVADTRSWLEGLLSGQLIAGTLAQIKAAVEGIAAPIVDAVTGAASAVGAKVQDVVNAIAGVAENTAEADMTDRMKQFKIPDLFILILKVILACIRLMLRALVFIATLPTIPASAGDIDSNFLSGVDFLKNQTIPYFNVSLWSIVTGVIAIFFGLAVVKRVRRIYSV